MKKLASHLAIVTSSGAKTYSLGDIINGKIVDRIELSDIHYCGDPCPHYIGYSSEEQIFAVNALCASVIEWL
jgi:hypothetical protein